MTEPIEVTGVMFSADGRSIDLVVREPGQIRVEWNDNGTVAKITFSKGNNETTA